MHNILAVQNGYEELELLRVILVLGGYKIDLAQDGGTVLRKIQQNNYDLLITSYLLPDMDGVKLVSRIPETKKIPVLFYTATVLTRSKLQRKLMGDRDIDIVIKPSSVQEILSAVERLLQRAERKNE